MLPACCCHCLPLPHHQTDPLSLKLGQKKEMRQLANATAAEIIRGIHDGKPAATLALMRQWSARERGGERGGDQFDRLEECAGITEAMLKNLRRCDESLASVFGFLCCLLFENTADGCNRIAQQPERRSAVKLRKAYTL